MNQCAKCKRQFPSDMIERHHPDKTGFPGWTITLCANCHRQVTNEQNRQRNRRISVANTPKWYRKLFMVPDELLQRKYDIRVASPRKLFRTLHDYLDDAGYAHKYESLKIEQAIQGTANFDDELTGKKSRTKTKRSRWKLIAGIILCLTIVLIPLGIRLIRKTEYTITSVVHLKIEGEAYLAKARPQELDRLETDEVFDVVSDVRVILDVGIDTQAKVTDKELTEGKHQAAADFKKLQSELTTLLPKVSLPQA